MTISLFGCAPATPIVVTIPTYPSNPFSATQTIIPPTESPSPAPSRTPFVPKATIKIAVQAPLSGGGSRQGNDIIQAAQLAVEQHSGPLTEMGYQIDLVPYDDQSSVEIGVANAKELAVDPKVLCGVGHYNSNVMIQASEIYHLQGLAFVSPATTSTTVTDRYYIEVNRVIGRDDGQGIAGARFAASQGFTRVFLLNDLTSSSRKIADYFRQEAFRLGVSVIGVWSSNQAESFDGLIRRILASNPEMIYFAGKADQAGPFFRDARTAGYMGTFLATDSVNRSNLAKLAGPNLVDGGGMYYSDMVAPASYYPGGKQFINDFLTRYDSPPLDHAAPAYDATAICIEAIKNAAIAKDGDLPTRAEVANAVRAIHNYQGITGTLNFNHKGDLTPAVYYVFKVTSPDPANWGQNTLVATYEIDPPR